MPQSNRNSCLADAAAADNRHEARHLEQGGHLLQVILTADQPDRATGQVGMSKVRCGSCCRLGILPRPRNGRHKTVAAAGQGCDVSRAVLSVAERFAQARDLGTQAALFDRDIGPNA